MRMTRTFMFFLFFLALLSLFPQVLLAQSPIETLRQYVSDLQKNPNDNALREKIIRHVQGMKPAPVVPGEVYEQVGKANYIIKNAQGEADFAEAVKSYQKALLGAPWVLAYYFNLGLAQEKAGLLQDAVSSFKFYLTVAPDAQDSNAVRERIGALKYAAEKRAGEDDKKAKEQQKTAMAKDLVARLNRAYAGKQFWNTSSCTPKYRWTEPGGFGYNAGCTWNEYNGLNWYSSKFVDSPMVLTFSLSSDGKNNILLNKGFTEPSFIGTIKGIFFEDIEWVSTFDKEKRRNWLKFYMDGTSFVESSSPVSPDSSDFDRNTPYRYTIYK